QAADDGRDVSRPGYSSGASSFLRRLSTTTRAMMPPRAGTPRHSARTSNSAGPRLKKANRPDMPSLRDAGLIVGFVLLAQAQHDDQGDDAACDGDAEDHRHDEEDTRHA